PYGLLTVEMAVLPIFSSNHERAALDVAASKGRDIRFRGPGSSETVGELELDRQRGAYRHRLTVTRLRREMAGGSPCVAQRGLIEPRAAGALLNLRVADHAATIADAELHERRPLFAEAARGVRIELVRRRQGALDGQRG